jgi:hypothetical protein
LKAASKVKIVSAMLAYSNTTAENLTQSR